MAADLDKVVVPTCACFPFLYAKIRDRNTSNERFAFYANRIMTVLAEEAIGQFVEHALSVVTPTAAQFTGSLIEEERFCVVSIVRAGDSLLEAVRRLLPTAKVGKILIQRDESTPQKLPKLFYSKFPPYMTNDFVLLCDPMLATGGSALCALDILVKEKGVHPLLIVFVCVVAAPEGIQAVQAAYPEVRIVAGMIDKGLNEEKYIMPGLGDFGDRFYNTTSG